MLTPEQKKTVAEWMKDAGWLYCTDGSCWRKEGYMTQRVAFSLTDAGLVVAELVKRGKEREFFYSSVIGYSDICTVDNVVWLFTTDNGEATNFFKALYEYLKEGK